MSWRRADVVDGTCEVCASAPLGLGLASEARIFGCRRYGAGRVLGDNRNPAAETGILRNGWRRGSGVCRNGRRRRLRGRSRRVGNHWIVCKGDTDLQREREEERERKRSSET